MPWPESSLSNHVFLNNVGGLSVGACQGFLSPYIIYRCICLKKTLWVVPNSHLSTKICRKSFSWKEVVRFYVSTNTLKNVKNHVLQHIFINSLLVVKNPISVPFLKTSQLAKMFKISNKKVSIMFGGVV